MEDQNQSASLMWSSPSPAILARRVRNAASMQSARSRETPTASAVRRELNAARMEMLRSQEPDGKAAERRARNAAAMQAARARETPEQATARRARNAARMVALRAKETPEQRSMRRSLNAARMQAYRAKEVMQDPSGNVAVKDLMDDDVMRNAVLATHRQPLKKRKDRNMILTDLDQQESARQQAPETNVEATPLLQSGDGSSKFSFHVN
ncbi:hypothetical protein ONE63_009417 [Megalurothrips usitatus]|uniref:Uncharacterized protein n=1 Tax=Megalurothrips usitatus TaxID=439358 RepID=A0AAV7XMW7_9NEOP|nr:hypothetical protein ONE63_009417 [Megalurothrips usitatus]